MEKAETKILNFPHYLKALSSAFSFLIITSAIIIIEIVSEDLNLSHNTEIGAMAVLSLVGTTLLSLKSKFTSNTKAKYVCYTLNNLSGVDEYDEFAKQLREKGIYDFADVVEVAETALKRREKELLEQLSRSEYLRIEAEKAVKLKSEFIASVSHELRTPLHSILSFSKICLKKLDIMSKLDLAKNIMSVQQNGDRLLRMIDEILDFSKLESGRMQFAFGNNDILQIANNVAREMQSLMLDNDITFQTINQSNDPSLVCDEFRVEQVIRNLISNSIKFTTRRGNITIVIDNDAIDGVPAVKLAVKDSGTGINIAKEMNIFEKFVQGGDIRKGTGLGLAICKEIVEAHNGIITAQNRKGGGAVVEFIIPQTQQNNNIPQEVMYAR